MGRFAAGIIGATVVLACAGQALADGRHGRGHGGHGGWGRHDHHRSSVSFRTGFSNCGSGFSIRVGSGWNDCGPRYSSFGYRYDSCAPRYCPPPVVYRPAPVVVYDSPVVVRQYPVYTPAPVVVSEPVVVQQPVERVVERPVVVERTVEKPVIVEKPVVVERVVEKPVYVEPAPQGTEPGRYQDRELGDAYLRMADPENAARAYKRYLAAWSGDGTAARNYGLAQVARGEVQEGFRNVAQGYRLESGLIKRPLRVQDLGGPVGFQKVLDAASRGAGGANTAEGWLTVAILQNANGQRDAAVNALQKARDAGLDQTLLDAFTLEFSRTNS